MAQSNNGQVGFARGALDDNNRRKFLRGDNFEYNGNMSQFWQGSYNQIPSSAFDMIGLQNNEIESQTGVKSFSGGIAGSALGPTATAARGALDATSVRRNALVRNIAENMIKPLMRKWLGYFHEFMEPEEIVRVTNSEFVPIRKDDLTGKLDIEISISTAEDNAARAEQYSFLLQTLGHNLPFELSQKVLAKIAKLARDPELEKDIKDFKQEPDPLAEKMKQISVEKAQLENDAIRAEIERNKARAFWEYCYDIEKGEHNSLRFYGQSWGISKTQAGTWIDDFAIQYDLYHDAWKLLNHYGHSSIKKTTCQSGQQEADNNNADKPNKIGVYDNTTCQSGQQEEDKL
jgi:hypothetical protein